MNVMTKLSFTRDPNSGYWANGEYYGYQLRNDGTARKPVWLLQVRRVVETAGVRHQLGSEVLHCWTVRFDNLAEAKAVVQHFEDDPRHDMFAAQTKYWREVTLPRQQAITAEYDAMIARRGQS